MATETVFDIQKIKELLPHRYPFLMLDRVIELNVGASIVGIKHVTVNEPFFAGHFPSQPVMPGVLILEALAQVAGCLAIAELGDEVAGRVMYFMAIDGAKFRKPVVPGDQVHLEVTKVRGRGAVWKFDGKATVDGGVVAEASLTAMLGADG